MDIESASTMAGIVAAAARDRAGARASPPDDACAETSAPRISLLSNDFTSSPTPADRVRARRLSLSDGAKGRLFRCKGWVMQTVRNLLSVAARVLVSGPMSKHRARPESNFPKWTVAALAMVLAGPVCAETFNQTPTRQIGPSNNVTIGASIGGQGGWTVSENKYDEEISAVHAHGGRQAWRVSNWYHQGTVNAALTPAFPPVKEGASGSRNHVDIEYWFYVSTGNAGLVVSSSLTDAPGSRLTYVAVRDDAGTLSVQAVGVLQGSGWNNTDPAPFDDPGVHYQIVSSGALAHDTWYRLHVTADLLVGAQNDQITYTVYGQDGSQVWTSGQMPSWEDAYLAGAFAPSGTVVTADRVGFRIIENPDDLTTRTPYGYASNHPAGLYLDDLSITPNIGTGLTTGFENDRYVSTNGTDSGNCATATPDAARCRTIAYALTQAGVGNTIHVASGMYDEAGLAIAQPGLAIVGDVGTRPVITNTSGGTNQRLLVVNNVQNVRIEHVDFHADKSFVGAGILAMGNVEGLVVNDNHFVQSQSTGAASTFKLTNAITVNYSDERAPPAVAPYYTQTDGSTVTITNNIVEGDALGLAFRAGIQMDRGLGTVRGNTIVSRSQDLAVRFATVTGQSTTDRVQIDHNAFNGSGVQISSPNAGVHDIAFEDNTVDAFSGTDTANYASVSGNPADFSVMRIIDNAANVPLTLHRNQFLNYAGGYRGVLIENFPGIVLDDNTFTPRNGASGFVSLVISNKELTTAPASPPLPFALVATDNTFNGNGTANSNVGTAVELLDDNDAGGTAAFGIVSFGTSGHENHFSGDLRWYFHLDDYTCDHAGSTDCGFLNYPGVGTIPDTQVRPFAGSVSAVNNLFDDVAPSANPSALLAHTYDKHANPVLGLVGYGVGGLDVAYVDATYAGDSYGTSHSFVHTDAAANGQTVYFGVNAFATVADAVAAVNTDGKVYVAAGSYAGFTLDKSAQVIGNDSDRDGSDDGVGNTLVTGEVKISSGVSSATMPAALRHLEVRNTTGAAPANGYGIVLTGNVQYVELNDLRVFGNVQHGLWVDAGADVSDLHIVDSTFDQNGYTNYPGTESLNVGAGFATSQSAVSVSGVLIENSDFVDNAFGGIVVNNANTGSASQITSWEISGGNISRNNHDATNPPTSTSIDTPFGAGGGLWLKTSGSGSKIDGIYVHDVTFADNGSARLVSGRALNRAGIEVRARAGTTVGQIQLCDNTFAETATSGIQEVGVYIYNQAGGAGYTPVEICGSNQFNGLLHSVSGYEQHQATGDEPRVNVTGDALTNWEDLHFDAASTVYVDDGFAGKLNGESVNFAGNPAPAACAAANGKTFGVDAFATITDALAHVTSGGNVCVAAGVYAENVTIDQAVKVFGAQATVNAGVDGTRDGSVAVNESILVPATIEPGLSLSSGGQAVVGIDADDVTVDGFVIDGDNPALTSSVALNSANPDVSAGVFALGNRMHLQNLVLRNLIYAGIDGYATSTPSGDNHIVNNRFTNITTPSLWGIGVLLQDNYYAEVAGNLMNEVRVGVQTNNDSAAAPGGFAPSIAGNEIHATRTAIFHNLFYGTASPYAISGNKLVAAAHATQTGGWKGLWLESMGSAQTVTIAGNIVDGSAIFGTDRTTAGYVLNNVTSTAPTAAIDGGSVSHVDVGVLSTDATGYTGPVNDFIVRNVMFDDVALGALYVEDTQEQTGSAKLTVGNGNMYTASVAHTLALSGAAPAVGHGGGAIASVFVRSARTFFNGVPSNGPCTPVACTVVSSLVNNGIAAVDASGVVDVEDGTFPEKVIVNKSVTLQGPHAGTPGDVGSRGTNEAIIAPASGVPLTIKSSNVAVDGLEMGHVTATRAVFVDSSAGTLSGVSFRNNRIVDYTATNSSGAGIFASGTAAVAATSGMQISNNLFQDLSNGAGYDPSAGPFAMGIKVSRNSGMVIADNVFRRVQSNAMQLTYAYGADVHGNAIDGGSANYTNVGIQVTYGNDVAIAHNTFSGTLQGFLFNANSGPGVSFTCNSVSNSSYGVRGASYETVGSTVSPAVFHNDLQVTTSSLRNDDLPGNIVIGSNYYGGSAPTTYGNVQAASALSGSPVNDPNCGNNTPATVLAVSGTPQTTAVSTAFAAPLTARVVDALGGSVAGASITFTSPASGASALLMPASGMGDYNGSFSASATANALSGTYAVTATSGAAIPANFMLTNSGTPSVALALNGPASTTTGTATPGYTAQLSNTGSALPENVLVDFVLSRSGGLSSGDVVLEYDTGSGYAPIPLTACGSNLCGSFGPPGTGFPVGAGYNSTTNLKFTSTRAGAIALAARVDGVTSHTPYAASGISVYVSAQAANIAANSATAFTGNAGQALAGPLPSVKVTDANNNPVYGYSVTFSAGSGSGTLSGATQTTNASGIATLGGWTLGTAATQTVTVTASGLTGSPVTFTATVPTVTLTASGPAQALVSAATVPYTDFLAYTGSVRNTGPATPQNVHYVITVTRIDDHNAPSGQIAIAPDDVQVCVNDPSGQQSDNKDCPTSAPESLFYSETTGALNGRAAAIFRYPINPAHDMALPTIDAALPPTLFRFKPGQYAVQVQIVGADNSTVYATATSGTSVPNAAVAYNGPMSGPAEQALLSTTTLTNSGGRVVQGNVIVRVTLSDVGHLPLSSTDVEFDYQNGASYAALPWTPSPSGNDLVTYFGPGTGFPLPDGYNATTAGRAIFHREGSYTVLYEVLDATDLTTLYASQTVTPIVIGANAASYTLSDLHQVYNGDTHPVTVTPTPSGATFTTVYEALSGAACPGSPSGSDTTPPTNAGSYCVYVTATGNYSGGATGKLVVAKAQATVSIDGADVGGEVDRTYDGSQQTVTGTAVATPDPTGTVKLTYNGDANAPTVAGSYSLLATLDDPNYYGFANGTLVVAASNGATITLNDDDGVNDGVIHRAYTGAAATAVTATTNAQSYSVTYVGSSVSYPLTATPPTAVGSYQVCATTVDPNYQPPMQACGTLVIDAIDASLTLGGDPVGAVTDASTPLYAFTSATTHLAGPAPSENVLASLVITRSGGATAGDLDLDYFALSQEGSSCVATTTPANGYWCPLPLLDNGDGTLSGSFGPPVTGFPLTDGATSYFRTLYHRGGQYVVSVSIDGVSTGTEYASAAQTADVAYLALSASSPANAATGAVIDSSVTLTNTGTAAVSSSTPAPNHENVIGQFAIASDAGSLAPGDLTLSYLGPDDAYHAITLTTCNTNQLCGSFGGSGFPVAVGYNATSLFRTVFAAADHYTFTTRIVGASSGAVFATTQQVVAVAASSASIAIDAASLAQTYNGGQHPVIVTTTPAGLSYTVTYGGNATAPTDAGDYAVVATITQAGYSGSDTQTLHVAKAMGSVSFAGATNVTFDGLPHSLTAALDQDGAATCTPTNVGEYPRTNAGSTTVNATCVGTNYTASGSTTLTVSPKPVTITLSDLGPFAYDGATHAATATVGGAVSGFPATTAVTYNGSGAAPSAVGSYNVVAALDPSVVNYTATPASGVLVIGAQNVAVTLSNLSATYDGNPHAVAVGSTPTVTTAVTYDGNPTPPTNAGSYTVVATVTQAGYSGSASGTLVIAKANAPVTLENLSATYDGNPHAATASTTPNGLTTSITYDGAGTIPTNAGSYAVVASVVDPNYVGSTSGTLTIAKAPATVTLTAADLHQAYGATHAVGVTTDPAGLSTSVTYDGSTDVPTAVGSYSVVATVTDANHIGSASGTLVVGSGAAQTIAANGGTSFTGTAGQPLVGALPSVQVTDAGGNPVAGVAVTFAAATGNGTLSGATQTTDQNGIATLGGWTLDATPGQNTVTATAAGVTGTVTFTADGAAAGGALGVTFTDGRTATQVGRELTYTITVGNGGSSNVSGVHVVDTLPAELDATTAHWQCIAVNGATCTASGDGSLDQTVDLPAGSSVVYLLTATVTGEDADGMVGNEVDVTNGDDTITRTDDDVVVLFRDGFELGGDGSEPWPAGAQPVALGTLDAAQSLTVAVDAAQLGSLQRVTLAQADDGAFRVEAIRIGASVYVRLVARTAQGESASDWSALDGSDVALVLDGARLGLVGAKADLGLTLAQGGAFAVGGVTRH